MTLKSSPLSRLSPSLHAPSRPPSPCSAPAPRLDLVGTDAPSAQGVTTSAITGFVRGQDGLPLADAVVVAVHVPSGTQYRTVVRTGGTYSLPNLRVGGPYTITATMIGFTPESRPERLPEPRPDAARGLRAEPPGGPAGGARGHGGEGRCARRRAHRCRDVHRSGTGRSAALHQAKHARPDPAGPPERRQLRLRRPQLAVQQHFARRLVLQQPVRPGRSGAGRPDQRRAGAVRRGGAGAGLAGAVRRA